MKKMFKQLTILTMPFLLLSCSSIKVPEIHLPMLNGDYRELETAPKDASLYQCEKNKKFYVKSLRDSKEMWLIFPDREFGLKQVETSKNIYNNDTTKLEINDPETYIKEGDVVTYQKCHLEKLK